MKATSDGGSFKTVKHPVNGTSRAVCYGVVDLGTTEDMFNNQSQGESRKVLIMWELSDHLAKFSDDEMLNG